MFVVTTNDMPGWRVEAVVGEVFGLTVRARNVGAQLAQTAGQPSVATAEDKQNAAQQYATQQGQAPAAQ
ncbi:MAG: heavy metal-binding domain-containing protein [Candidatus Nanopelagicales bacterium]